MEIALSARDSSLWKVVLTQQILNYLIYCGLNGFIGISKFDSFL